MSEFLRLKDGQIVKAEKISGLVKYTDIWDGNKYYVKVLCDDGNYAQVLCEDEIEQQEILLKISGAVEKYLNLVEVEDLSSDRNLN